MYVQVRVQLHWPGHLRPRRVWSVLRQVEADGLSQKKAQPVTVQEEAPQGDNYHHRCRCPPKTHWLALCWHPRYLADRSHQPWRLSMMLRLPLRHQPWDLADLDFSQSKAPVEVLVQVRVICLVNGYLTHFKTMTFLKWLQNLCHLVKLCFCCCSLFRALHGLEKQNLLINSKVELCSRHRSVLPVR